MNLATIRTFLAIVQTRNLSRAANQLNITQSTVTARLNALEQELNQRLFERRKSGTELTSAGFKFQRYAELMNELWDQARRETALPETVDSTCNLGCHFDLWTSYGAQFFRLVRERVPGVALSAWPAEQVDLDRWLSNGLIDAALCYSPTVKENFFAHALPAERLVLVSTHPRQRMRFDPKYVYVDFGEEFRRSHAAAYADSDTPMTTFGSAGWALEFILEHSGSAYLPESLIKTELENGRLHPVPDVPVFERPVYLVVNRKTVENWSWFRYVVTGLSQVTQY